MSDPLPRSVSRHLTQFAAALTRTRLDPDTVQMIRPGYRIMSNLPLQMSLYFNCYYYPIWLLNFFITLIVKYPFLPEIYRVLLAAVLVIMSLLEPVRLYFGYAGNLAESIPQLAGFWLLSLLIQLPLTSFVIFHAACLPMPLERACHAVLLAFVLFQVGAGLVTLTRMARERADQAHVEKALQESYFENLAFAKEE